LIKTPPGWGFLQFLADEKARRIAEGVVPASSPGAAADA
jgi:hypothetical protein